MSNHIPDGYAALTPYFCLQDVAGFAEFARQAFGAEERKAHRDGDGRLVHGELVIEGVVIELSEATEDWKPMAGAFHLFVEDPDAVYSRALDAGAESIHPPTDHEYGERSSAVKDRWGHHWYVAAVTDPAIRNG